jgi:surfeit locus 1 family protein
MRRIPLFPTIVVACAIAAMIALGLWQLLERLPQKEAFVAQIAANPAKPAIRFPAAADERLLFRRATALCRDPAEPILQGAGAAGYRLIVRCRGGADAPAMMVQLGTTRDTGTKIAWPGGVVSGFISHAPDSRSLIGSLFEDSPRALMLVLDTPPAGLKANNTPDIASIPNSHLAYAGQWFFFAAIAAVIYALALRRRRPTAEPA